MPQIKLDFLFLVQTWVLRDKATPLNHAMWIASKALDINAECLNRKTLCAQTNEFCSMLLKTGCADAPAWVKWER